MLAGTTPASANTTDITLEQCTVFRFEWGGCGVIPEVPSVVDRSAFGPLAIPNMVQVLLAKVCY